MKKIFTKAMAVVMLLSTGLTTVSCGSEEIKEIINTILPTLIENFLNGKTTVYTGNAAFERRWYGYQGENYVYFYADGDKHDYLEADGKGKSVVRVQNCSLTAKNQQVTITFDPFTVGGVQINSLTIIADYVKDTETNTTFIKIGSDDQMYNYSLIRTYNGEAKAYDTATLQDYDNYYGTAVGTVKDNAVSIEAEVFIGEESFVVKYTGTAQQNQ